MYHQQIILRRKPNTMPCLCILFSLALILSILGGDRVVSSGYPLSLPGCPDKCGNMSVPYPFGTQQGCYLDETFLITCDDINYNPPKAFLGTGNVNVTEIMLLSGELRSRSYIAHRCFDSNGTLSEQVSNDVSFRLRKFSVSYSKNEFMVIGCDTTASFQGSSFTTSCTATCMALEDVVNGSCAAIGCCQTSIPRRAKAIVIQLRSMNNHINVSSFDRCSHAFVAEEAAYNFSSLDFTRLTKVDDFPVILDWTVGNLMCEEAKRNLTSYSCSENSECYESDNGPGYRCKCTQGYEGNPYLQNGCQDIDECTLSDQPCNGTCINFPGGYKCSCPEGYTGNGRKDGNGCTLIPKSNRNVLILALGVSISISALLVAGAWIYWIVQKRKHIQLRKKHFQENGGIALQSILSQHERKIDAFKIFKAEELKQATNNYEEKRVLGKGGQGTVYKGELPDNTIVAIKKSNVIDKSQVQQFINEVVMLSQVNHINVVKLLGCCLETEVPMLVYEFITNGTLFDQIQKDQTPRMPWHTRLRIAAEAAGALSYLHFSASIPIIHRDIKTTNILLDSSYTAKVSDFGTSRFAPMDKTALTTLVQGTLGYLDPEYYFSSQLTEKSDVFSFGVVLLELLTGEKALNFDRKEGERSLATYFALSMKEDRLFEIIEESIKQQTTTRQLTEVATIASRCLNMRGEDRPTMKEVAAELEGLLSNKEMDHPWVQVSVDVDQEDQYHQYLLHGSMGNDSISLPASSLPIGR